MALLLADCLNAEQRRAMGWTLVGVGVLTTLPLAAEVLGRNERQGEGVEGERWRERMGASER